MALHQQGAAAAAGQAAPESGEAPSRDQAARGFRGDATRDGPEYAGGDEALQLATFEKNLTTLQAKLALKGVELQPLANGTLQAVGLGLLVRFTDLDSAVAWSRGRP